MVCALNGPGTVFGFFQSERHPRVQLVLDIGHHPVALVAGASRVESADVTSESVVNTVVQVRRPTGIAAARRGIEPARQRQPQFDEAALRPYWLLGSDGRDP